MILEGVEGTRIVSVQRAHCRYACVMDPDWSL